MLNLNRELFRKSARPTAKGQVSMSFFEMNKNFLQTKMNLALLVSAEVMQTYVQRNSPGEVKCIPDLLFAESFD